MVNYGMGSYTSPIVISDDEDDAFVEMQLEDRLSDAVFDDEPEDSYYYQDYDDRFDLEDTLDYRDEWYPDEEEQEVYEIAASLKRKRSVSPEIEEIPAPLNTNPQTPPLESKESKRAKKKRLRKEGLLPPTKNKKTKKTKAQQKQAQQAPQPGPSTAVHQEFMPLPPKPILANPHYDIPPPFPAQPLPISYAPMFPPVLSLPAFNPTIDFDYPIPLPPLPPSLRLPRLPHLPPRPPSPPLPPPVAQAPLPPTQNLPLKRIIGMPYPDPGNKDATYASFAKILSPLPDPARTLIMVMLPKKFRTPAFATNWARSFDKSRGPKVPPRVEVDLRAGKTLVEFKTPELAQAAWGSPRLPVGDGKEHIRVWWYHEIEEGEIGEEGEIIQTPPPLSKKEKAKAKAAGALPPAQPILPTVNNNIPVQPLAGPSNTSSKPGQGAHIPVPPSSPPKPIPSMPTSFVLSATSPPFIPSSSIPLAPSRPSPLLYLDTASKPINPPLPSATSTTFSVTGEESMDLSDDGLEDSHAPASRKLPYSFTNNGADTSTSTLVADTSIASQASSSSTATSSPVLPSLPIEKPIPRAPASHRAALLAKQKLLEESIAQTKKELAAKHTHEPSPPKASPPTPPQDTQSAETALRQRIIESRKKRLASAASVPLPTSHPLPPKPAPPMASTVTKTSVSLDALAVSFISETIHTAAVSVPTTTLPKKPSPPPAVQWTIAAREKELRRLIAESGSLMDKYKKATTKPEKDAIMVEIRKCTRACDAMKNIQILPPALKPTRPVSPWPKTSEDAYILVISDTEDESEGEDDDDDAMDL